MTTVQNVSALEAVAQGHDLYQGINAVAKAAGGGSTLPILSGIKLTAQAGTLGLEATTLDMTARLSLPAATEDEGSLVVDAGPLTKFAKFWRGTQKQPSPDVYLGLEDRAKDKVATFRYQDTANELKTMPLEDWPDTPEPPEAGWAWLPADDLRSQLQRVQRFAMNERQTARLNLTGVFWRFCPDDTLTLVGTDGYRLGRAYVRGGDLTGLTGIETTEALINAEDCKTFLDMVKKLGLDPAEIGIALTDDHLFMRAGELDVAFRRINEEFPQFEYVIPSENRQAAHLKMADVQRALERCKVTAPDSSGLIVLHFQDDDQGIVRFHSSSSAHGQTDVKMGNLDSEINPTVIGANVDYLIDLCKALKDDADTLAFATLDAERSDMDRDLCGMTIWSPQIKDFLVVQMPVRIK